MRKVSCLVCSYREFDLFCTKKEDQIVKCKKCNFIFANPQPTWEQLTKFYEYFDYKDPHAAEVAIRRDARRSLKIIYQCLKAKGSLLDMGCGRGYFLDEARAAGWNVWGVDYSKQVIDYAKKKLNLNVQVGDIFSYKTSKKFSLIVLNQVIEHVLDPKRLIDRCYELLNPKGYLYIATPNINSISARVFGCEFEHIIPPEHVSYFSKESIGKLLNNNNFAIIHSGSWSYPENLAGIIRRLIGTKHSSNYHKRETEILRLKKNTFSTKKIKHLIFDQWFCGVFYRFLELDSFGINLEVVAKKK